MNQKKRAQIFTRFREANPKPQTELIYSSNFQLLVAVVLSAQSTDKAVNLATKTLFNQAPDAHSMLNYGEAMLKESIKTIGLYNNKAKNLIKLCEILVDKFEGQVPDNRADLESLPGVGRKTANVVLNTAFGQPTMAVDTHIFRICNRINLAPGKNVNQVEQKLLKTVPGEFILDAHHWLILHGRYVCTARKPLCGTCIIFDLCEYKDKDEIATKQSISDGELTAYDHGN